MPAGEGQEVPIGNTEKHIREETIHQDGKEIAVVGIDHDADPQRGLAFAGRQTAELALEYGLKGAPNALLMDSMYCLTLEESTGHYLGEASIRDAINSKNDIDTLDFHDWQIRYAYEHGADLILGDPVHASIPNYLAYLGDRLDLSSQAIVDSQKEHAITVAQSDEYKEIQENIGEANDHKFLAKAGLGAGAVVPLAAYFIARGIKEDVLSPKRLTRRQVIKRAAGYGVGLVGGGVALQQTEKSLSNKVKKLEHRRQELTGGYPPIPEYEIGMTWNELVDRDNNVFRNLMNSPAVLQDVARNTSSFQRIAYAEEHAAKILVVFRNAVMADVLSAQRESLTSASIDDVKEAQLGVVLGASHVLVPKECSVSYFVQNDQAREKALKDNLSVLLDATRSELGEEAVKEFKEQLRTFAKSYKIHADGSVDVRKISPPLLTEIIDDFEIISSDFEESISSSQFQEAATVEPSPTLESIAETPIPEVDHESELEQIKERRVKHLLRVYGKTMDKEAYGDGDKSEAQISFMKELVDISYEISPETNKFAYQLAAVIHFLKPGFGFDKLPNMDQATGLLQLSAPIMGAVDGLPSFSDVQVMPPIEQLKYVVKPYLQSRFDKELQKSQAIEDIAMSSFDPASLGKDGATPILHTVSARQEPIYIKLVDILKSQGKNPEEDGVLTKREIGDAIIINAIQLGEEEKNLR